MKSIGDSTNTVQKGIHINKIREIDNNVNLLSLEDFLCISVVKYFDEEEYVKYIKRKFKESELNKLLFMCGFISEGTDLTDGSTIFHISQTSEPFDFISDEEVDKAIETCVRDKSIKKLTKNQALMIAAFSLRNSRENAQDGFTEKECGEVLKKWGYFSKNATV